MNDISRRALIGSLPVLAAGAATTPSEQPQPPKRNLEQTLQRLYDSEINVTITMLWDGGVEYALISYMEYDGATKDDWYNVRSFAELADALHHATIAKYPNSGYSRRYGSQPSEVDRTPTRHIDVVFDGPPGPEPGRFVEVEDDRGHSLDVGEWRHRPDGYWALRFPAPPDTQT